MNHKMAGTPEKGRKHGRAAIASPDRPELALLASLLIALVAIAACTLTPDQRDDREYRRREFEDEFVDFRRQCLARGGWVFIDAKQTLGRGDIPHRGDHYTCG